MNRHKALQVSTDHKIMLTLSIKTHIRKKLLRWFKRNSRDLPWRKTRDPYAIWISEIMLQQTQVDTVIPYYRKFLKTFPAVKPLAGADLSKVLKLWEGLGYYSRARNLHRASRVIAEKFHGSIPDNSKDLLSLPGIGRYTAGAILSIAHNKEAAILDGNVKRVLSRLFAVSGNPAEKETEEALWQISEALVPEKSPGDFNQALMDLGSMVCTPRDPQCVKCPLRDDCTGTASGDPERYPSRKIRKAIPHIEAVAGVIMKDGKVLVRQRAAEGLLGGLWEFPNWEVNPSAPRHQRRGLLRVNPERRFVSPPSKAGLSAVERVKDQKNATRRLRLRTCIKKEIGMKADIGEPIGVFQQTFSHFRLTLHVYRCEAGHGEAAGEWVSTKKLGQLPMSRIHRRIAQTISDRRFQIEISHPSTIWQNNSLL
jgi:A/G-specific adenine glycosylase